MWFPFIQNFVGLWTFLATRMSVGRPHRPRRHKFGAWESVYSLDKQRERVARELVGSGILGVVTSLVTDSSGLGSLPQAVQKSVKISSITKEHFIRKHFNEKTGFRACF